MGAFDLYLASGQTAIGRSKFSCAIYLKKELYKIHIINLCGLLARN